MKPRFPKVLAPVLTVMLSTALTATRADTSSSGVRLDRGRFVMPFGFSPDDDDRLLSFEDELDEEEDEFDGQVIAGAPRFRRDDSSKSWLLARETFQRLSSAGQRAVLLANRRLHGRRTTLPFTAQNLIPEAVSGANIRVNNPALDSDFHTHSETSIAVNGNTIMISFNEFGGNGYSVSTDMGDTWTHRRTPDPTNGFNLGDGVVAFGPNNESYYAGLAFLTSGSTFKSIVGVAKSTDNGVTFSKPADASTIAGNTTDMQDKEWLAVDSTSSPFRGNVYVTWTDFTRTTGSFIAFARSRNGGSTFDPPIGLSPRDNTSLVQGSVPVVAPNGDLYVAFSDGHAGIGGIGIVKSTDGGNTFSAEKRLASVVGVSTMTGGGGVRTNSFPSVTIDGNGAVHVVYASWTLSQVDRGDIFYVRSTDGGTTFSTPKKLNDDATNTTQTFPSIAASSDGKLGVKWADRRNDPLNDGLSDIYMSISTDGGGTFGKNFRVSDHNWAFGPIEVGFAGGYHGDYDGIAADGSNFYLSWSDERNGEADAFFCQQPTTRDPNLADFNISALKLSDAVVAGGAVSLDFATSASNAFSGNLTVSASPPINGVTYDFSSPTVNAGAGGTVNIVTSSDVQPGTYLITLNAAGGGLTRRSSFRLNVFNSAHVPRAPVNASRTRGFTTMQAGVKVDPSGTVHAVFDDDSDRVRSDDVFYSRSTDSGVSFSSPVKISGSAAPAFESTLALDSAGNPFVAFTAPNPVPANGSFATFLLKSTDHGNTFSTPILASGNVRDAGSPKLAVDNNGNIFVAFVDFSQPDIPVMAVRSVDGGNVFSNPVRVSQSGEITGNPPFIAADSMGAAFVVYQDSGSQTATIKLATALDGQNYSAPRIISDVTVNAFAPQIAIDGSNNVFVAFYDRFGQTTSTFNREAMLIKSTDRGGSFGPQLNVSNNSGQSTFASLIVGNQGNVVLAWEDTSDDPQRDVMAARSTDGGATFAPAINVSSNGARSFGAFGGMDAGGNIFVAWTDDFGANTDVFVSLLNPSAVEIPDFSLSVNPASLAVPRGNRVELTVTVNRFGGFGGNVTITPPDLAGLKTKKVKFNTTSTGGTFSFKLKAGGVTGLRVLTFSGQDATGRTRTGTTQLTILPGFIEQTLHSERTSRIQRQHHRRGSMVLSLMPNVAPCVLAEPCALVG